MIAGANSSSLLLVIETQRRGADVLTAVRKELGDLGVGAQQAGVAIAAGADAGIREIEKLSRTIDVNSKRDVAAFKQSAQGVRELAQAAGIAPAEIQKLSTAEAVLEARLKAANQEARAQAAQITGLGGRMDVMSPKVRTAANAMSVLSTSAAGFTSGGAGAAMAAANMAQSIAALSSSAALAASATGIGAIVLVLSTIYNLIRQVNNETETMGSRLADAIKGTTDMATAVKQEAVARQLYADAMKRVAEAESGTRVGTKPGAFGIPDLQVLTGATIAEKKAVTDAQAAITEAVLQQQQIRGRLAKEAGEKAVKDARATADRLGKERKAGAERASAMELQIADQLIDLKLTAENRLEAFANNQAEKEFLQREREVKALYDLEAISLAEKTRLIAEAYQVRTRLQEQNHQKQVALEEANRRSTLAMQAAGGTVSQKYGAAVEDIDAAAKADEKSGYTREQIEARTQLRIRQLQKETLRATVGDLKTIENATINSKNRQIRAIGLAAQTLRRLEIGAEAARALVESARAFGKVPGYLAAHQYGSAALSAASGVQLAAAASLGFREAGTGGGGSGSAGGAGERGTFEPRPSSSGAGSLNLTLITRNPYGRDEIQNVIYEINRAGVLKRPPIEIPATSTLDRLRT